MSERDYAAEDGDYDDYGCEAYDPDACEREELDEARFRINAMRWAQ